MSGHGLNRGFALVTAIFVVVVLASLSAYLVSLSAVQHGQGVASLQGARAHFAARAGLEWASYHILCPGAGQEARCPAQRTAANPLTVSGPLPFEVAVSCVPEDVEEGGTTVRVFQVEATAAFPTLTQPASRDSVRRALRLTLACDDPTADPPCVDPTGTPIDRPCLP
jgi:MSHA biogenesis protein MshP